MNRLVVSSSRCWRVLRWVGLAAAGASLWACTSRTMEAPTIVPSVQQQWLFTQKINNNLDILFMIDNSKSMTAMQQKLLAQLPSFMNVLENLPIKPNLHVAVVSSDMGAKSDNALQSCTPLGNQGDFFSQPEGSCLATTLAAGDTFISDVDGVSNFTDPIASVFQCIGFLGATGCGFEHQLASIDRALGADGLGPVPSMNAGFLRPDASLGIVMLTNEDDCSAPTDTTIYSLNGSPQSITNPDGPIADYRCNGGPRGGHLCKDPKSTERRLRHAARQPALRRDRQPDHAPARRLQGQRQRLQRPHPGQQVRQRHQGAQARSRPSDPGRRNHRSCGALCRRVGPDRDSGRNHGELAAGHALLRRRRRSRRQPRSLDADGGRRELRRSRASERPSSPTLSRTACWPRSATRTTPNR